MKSIFALMLGVLASLIWMAIGVNVVVCHHTGSQDNPYTYNNVSVHSVDDARGLNGHGLHIEDAWKSFVFDGVTYPGQNEYLFGTVIDDNCNLITTGTPTPTDTPTATPTECCCPTPTPRPVGDYKLMFPMVYKYNNCDFGYCK